MQKKWLLCWGLMLCTLALAGQQQQRLIEDLNQRAEETIDSQPDTAFVCAQRALGLASRPAWPQGLARAHELLGRIFYHQAVFRSAIEHLLLAHDGYQQTGQRAGMAKTSNLLGLAYYYSLETALARKNHEEALAIYEALGDSLGRAETFGYLGHLYEKEKDYPKALTYQQSALKLYEQAKNAAGMGKILENLGSIYEDFGDYPRARDYFSRALTYSREANEEITVINTLNNIGDTYRKEGNLPEALRYTRQACTLARQVEQQYMLRSALKDLSKTYALMGNYREAHACLDSSYALYEIIYDDESAKQLARMQTVYETARKNKEILLLESGRRIFLLWSGLIAVILTGLGIAAAIVSRTRRARRLHEQMQMQQEHLLMSTQLENTRLNEQKLNTELENRQLKEIQLQMELEQRAKELTSYTLQIVQKNTFLEQIKEKLIEIKKSEKDKGKLLRALIHSIDHNFKQDQDWDDFKRTFEQVHQDFFLKLQTAYPDLSSNDLRICALLKLNLASPDIATLLGISQDSFRTARYRLRKKLRLEDRASLRALIMTF